MMNDAIHNRFDFVDVDPLWIGRGINVAQVLPGSGPSDAWSTGHATRVSRSCLRRPAPFSDPPSSPIASLLNSSVEKEGQSDA